MFKEKTRPVAILVILAFVFGVLGGVLGAGSVNVLMKKWPVATTALIKEFYQTENAVYVSPHSLRKAMDRQATNYILVDLRSQQEYEREHIVGAINIPAYKDPDTSAYDEVERIVAEFKKLPQDKEIIVYCYSLPCMTGRKVGQMLFDHGIFVKLLGIGWNEWRYFWTLWNHEHEWAKTKVEDYVVGGKEPGTPKTDQDSTTCPIEGEFGC